MLTDKKGLIIKFTKKISPYCPFKYITIYALNKVLILIQCCRPQRRMRLKFEYIKNRLEMNKDPGWDCFDI
jgi:hypothetical protein